MKDGAGAGAAGEGGLLVEIAVGQRDRGREQQLVWEMWLGSIRQLQPGRGRYKSVLASRKTMGVGQRCGWSVGGI